MSKINLGDECQDRISGFKGIAVAKTEWIHGCTRVCLQPPVGADGKHPDSCTFDEPALVVVTPKAAPKDERKVKTGGSQNDQAALRR